MYVRGQTVPSPPELPPLDGTELFSSGNFTVVDFWRWALGDLRMNTARGSLAEFLVARAVDSSSVVRVEWGAQDVIAPDGTRIEVKTSAYLQSWAQPVSSSPSFGLTGATKSWDPSAGAYVEDPTGRVDVWVFALQGCKAHELYDPLDVDQWSFWVLPAAEVDALGQKSARVSTIRMLAGDPHGWSELAMAIRGAAEAQARHRSGRT